MPQAPNPTAADNWREGDWNPNAAEVLARRAEFLEHARMPPVPNRIERLRGLAAGRSVLDLGVVQHGLDSEADSRWLHAHLRDAADTCLGVDILEDDVAALVAKGYDVVVHDFTVAPMDGRYDLVVAGELIEHLGNPQAFLENLAASIAPGGRLVLTTPNPYQIHRIGKFLRGRFPDSADHVTMFTPSNMAELAYRSGLRIDAWYGVRLMDLPGAKNRLASVLRRGVIAAGGVPELAAETLMFELVPVDRAPDT